MFFIKQESWIQGSRKFVNGMNIYGKKKGGIPGIKEIPSE